MALGERFEMKGGGDQRFAGAGGGVEDDVLFVEQFEDGLFLGGIECQTLFFDVFEESAKEQ
jgi:hypothetical protein